jgi:hypothetical protein
MNHFSAHGMSDSLASSDSTREAGVRFLNSLTPDDVARCPYHLSNWKLVADESVRILRGVRSADTVHYLKVARRSRLRGKDRRSLESLFRDPIVLGDDEYVNGQHRGCAARFSGADRIAVVVGETLVREEPDVWIYEGGG